MQFHLANHVIDLNRRELRRGAQPVAVEPQVFDLLVYLVENRNRVVSKDDLIASIWGGRIVSDSTLTSRINAARKALGDSGKDQRLIRTISRKGVRFIGDVREHRADTNAEALPAPDQQEAGPPPPPPILDRPSIAVLPFDNLSRDPGLEIVADGLVEDVIALLARVPGFFVIARASSFVYKQRPCEIRQVGTELGVRYVVTGSVRSSGERMRIMAQLNEAVSGGQLWASRYDVERGDTLDVQDQIAREIAIELEPALTRAEMAIIRRHRPDNVDAWTRYRQAIGAIALGGWNETSIPDAIEQLHSAIAIEPNFALARALLALLNAFGANLSLIPVDPAHSHARQEAERAVGIDPHASDVLGYAGCALADIGEVSRGYELLERALELDPSNAQARVALGAAQVRLKRYESGIDNLRLGMRSSPRDFRLGLWGMILADALVRVNRLDEALIEASTASRHDSRLHWPRVITAWVMTKLDKHDEARQALAEARRIRPKLSLDEISRLFGAGATKELSIVWQ